MSGIGELAGDLDRAAAAILALLEHERTGIVVPDELKDAAIACSKQLIAFAPNLMRHDDETGEDQHERH